MDKEEKKQNKFFCEECGYKIEKESKFCKNCGAKVIIKETKKEKNKEEKTEDFNDSLEDDKLDNISDIELSNKPEIKEESKIKKESFTNKIKNDNVRKSLKDNRVFIACISSMITLLICIIFTVCYCNYFIDGGEKEVTTVNKDVIITDTGIAEAVSKVYDSVVVVETYVQGKLYATGTGFVYKTSGDNAYILTNNHVIESGTEIKVVFTNKDEIDAKIVGTDSYSDIALLSVDKDKIISVAEIGSSNDLSVGDTTFAVGAPLDSSIYSWTVTRGILSGKNRLVEVSTSSSSYSSNNYVMEVLQTDTAINSGNSGGPLCNANGEVIGITNMKISSSSVEGMGFAIPIETAIEYAEKFINGEAIVRPYLGISMYDMSNSIYGASTTGIYLASVESGSPADKAGLQKGDIITKIGDVEVESSSYLKYELYKYDIGDKVSFTYTRNNKEYTTTVTLGTIN